MFRTYRAKLQTVFVSLGLAAIALTGWEASAGATAALEAATYERLTAIRQTRVRQVERYFEDLASHVRALAGSEEVSEALGAFRQAWRQTPAAGPAEERELRAYYAQFVEAARNWFPADRQTIELQLQLLARNPYKVGEKDRLVEAPGAYGRVHARFHSTFHRYLNAFGFYDIFLVDAADERVLYTVFKEIDLGVPLQVAPFRESSLAEVTRRALALTKDDEWALVDYEPYVPSHLDPAAFLAAPIRRNGRNEGVLVIQVSIYEVNRVLTGDNRWREDGLGRTGQAYAVGPDNRLRSDMRSRLEDAERYYAELRAAGTAEAMVNEVRQHGTAILRLGAAPEVARFRSAAPGTEVGRDARGVRVLRSHAPLRVKGLNWALVAEMEEDEALEPERALRRRILGIGGAIAAGFFITAAWLARSVTQPVRALAESASRLGQRDFSGRLPVKSADELGQLAASFNRMAEDLARTTVSKEELERLAGQLLTAQEDERRRIARELHDDVSQRMAAIAIRAGQLEHAGDAEGFGAIKRQMGELSDEIHRLSRSLHPKVLEDLGLVAAIEQECRNFFERGGPPVEYEHTGDFTGLRRETEIVLFRVAQEALRNIEKHAAAEHVRLRLERSDGGVRMQVSDDGRGFRREAPEGRRGIGLTSMLERVRPLGGRLEIESEPGKGTRIDVWLP